MYANGIESLVRSCVWVLMNLQYIFLLIRFKCILTSMGLRSVIFTSTVPAVKRKDVRVGVNKPLFWIAAV